MMFINNFYSNWKITISRLLERGTALFKQSCVYLLVFTVTAITPTAVFAGETDELKQMIEQMEVRHQQEMEAMHMQIDSLTKA